ncbi:MAG: hypothetical protein Q8R35_03610 [bacterium]|nr:hypothetical protein [bacterium]
MALQAPCDCPCAYCQDDQHILCSNRRCGIGPRIRQDVKRLRPGSR